MNDKNFRIKRALQTIGEQLIKARKAKKLSQAEMAKTLGIARASLSYIESGKSSLQIETLYELCHALELDIQKILPSQEDVFPVKNKEGDLSQKVIATHEKLLSKIENDNQKSDS